MWTCLSCFGSSSCCITQLWTDDRTFSLRMLWCRAEFMVPSILARFPGPEAAKHAHPITLPLLRLTVAMMFWLYLLYARHDGTCIVQKVPL
uniref:Uncharacterized protein n=1 Tax=Anguilla anguilla TaxID=7936 RepID=A0A0E9SK06_ANGAN